jgi:paraquat-inducible protein B
MSQKANPALIGGFVVGALALLVIVVMYFATWRATPLPQAVIFFSESINGLNVGAPVKLKGVTVGKVNDILVVADPVTDKIATPVVIEMDPSKVLTYGRPMQSKPGRLKDYVEKGLRAQLALQSLVTGQLYVELDYKPHTAIRLLGENFKFTPYGEIPSMPSSKEEIQNTVGEAISEIRNLPIQETMQAIAASVKRIQQILESGETQSILVSADRALIKINKTLDQFDSKLDPTIKNINLTLSNSQELIKNFNNRVGPVMTGIDDSLKNSAALMQEAKTTLSQVNDPRFQVALESTLDELAKAARGIHVLADYLERNPDSLIYGKQTGGD